MREKQLRIAVEKVSRIMLHSTPLLSPLRSLSKSMAVAVCPLTLRNNVHVRDNHSKYSRGLLQRHSLKNWQGRQLWLMCRRCDAHQVIKGAHSGV